MDFIYLNLNTLKIKECIKSLTASLFMIVTKNMRTRKLHNNLSDKIQQIFMCII